MDKAKREKLEKAGIVVTDASEWLGLSKEEEALVEIRVNLARGVGDMPEEIKELMMSDGSKTVEEFIVSHPKESWQYLISAVSECLKRHYSLNKCELESSARDSRYDWPRTA